MFFPLMSIRLKLFYFSGGTPFDFIFSGEGLLKFIFPGEGHLKCIFPGEGPPKISFGPTPQIINGRPLTYSSVPSSHNSLSH